MSKSNPLVGRTLVVLSKRYTMWAAFYALDKLLRLFLIVRNMNDQIRMPDIPCFTNFH